MQTRGNTPTAISPVTGKRPAPEPRRAGVLLAALAGGLVLAWLLLAGIGPSDPIVSPTEAATRETAGTPATRALAPLVQTPPMDPFALAQLEPDRQARHCAAPLDTPEGRHRAGSAIVLVLGGQTTLLAEEATGNREVLTLGRWLGQLQWTESECAWVNQSMVTVSGRVLPNGIHRVAGCPSGDVVMTDSAGAFEIQVPAGHNCTLRVARSDG